MCRLIATNPIVKIARIAAATRYDSGTTVLPTTA
jgi:hypothetical protein